MYKCNKCGYTSPGFLGKCPECGAWGSLEESIEEKEHKNLKKSLGGQSPAKLLKDVELKDDRRILTGLSEFDRVMGGGILKDSLTILTAKPGSGKSTLLLQISNILAEKGKKILYASGEESSTQIKSRALRIDGRVSDRLWVISTNSLDKVIEEAEELDIDILIIDSIQTFTLGRLTNRPGSPTQIMECTYELMSLSKNYKRPRAIFIVGQMTKEDELAGVRSLEHAVDTVLYLTGDSYEELRILSTTKNRYGSTGEMGFFKMTSKGLQSIDNPSKEFMTERKKGEEQAGSALCVVREGTRPIILEIEALVSKSFMPYPTRISESLRKEQLFTIISILEQRAGLSMFDKNVVVKTRGGINLREGASNLAILMSIYSSLKDIPIKAGSIFIGDLGLTGELKACPSIDIRINEALRMGFDKIYIPDIKLEKEDKKLIKCKHIIDVINKTLNN